MCGKTPFEFEFLLIPLYDHNDIEKSPRELLELGTCKGASQSMHFVKSYAATKLLNTHVHIYVICNTPTEQGLLYEVPSGNQVDGLPLAASTGEDA